MPEVRPIPDELIALVQVQPLLKSLPLVARNRLIKESSIMTFAPGVTMIEEDQENGFLFLLLKGEAIAIMNGTEAGMLEAGDIAGEVSISGISPPIATVITRNSVEAIVFPAMEINQAMMDNPEFGRRLRQAAINRIAGR